ncbi:response regulator [uncultured Hymenobacter sp.]|uniref:response regulator n=1 Tax=uncultured Hymenobacter sp. TaxID=170016 RepID=UPI0035CC68AC
MQKLSSVLLVDDDSTTNFLNQLLLNSLGVAEQLLVAENGAEALQTLARTCPESAAPACPVLILLDVNMPIMNGIEFLEAYQRLPLAQRQAIVIVMLTTTMHARDLTRIQELPIAGLVSKPLTREKINTILQVNFQRELPVR